MAFFDESVTKNDKDNVNKNDIYIDPNSKGVYNPHEELEINKNNREQYENLMEDSKTKLDSYYDKNNIFVRLLLFLLFVFIIVGAAYYILLYFSLL